MASSEAQSRAILAQIQKPYANSEKKLITEAFEFANEAHKGQKRAGGEDYIVHPLRTALTLRQMELDAQTIQAALLHDTLDDTTATKEQIEERFGKNVAFLVEGVSKLGKIKYRGVERHAENVRKMLIALAQDFRVLLIKLADRYHNLQTLDALPIAKQKRIALESLEIYAPLAFRFGVSELSKKIEDLAFKYCYPQEYQMILENVQARYPEREKYLDIVRPYVQKQLIKEGIRPLEIQTRAKHYWSLYDKLKRYHMNWDAIYDLVAMRIIVASIEECYAALGIIHKLWKPLPGRIKDYIALPKPNGYQSIHTTVFCLPMGDLPKGDKGGHITEFQIRTKEMHEAAENGIAAHWLYREKDKPKQGARLEGQKFEWIKQIRQWQNETKESADFLENLKIDVFSNRIFVFTPKGDVIDLPEQATPVDFAYSIHSTLGDTCSQAKVNSEVVRLDQTLANGDMVEIIKDAKKHPSRDWLGFVKTNIARSHIRAHLKKARREEKIQEGETLLNKELERLNQGSWGAIPPNRRAKALQNLPYHTEQSLLAALGEGEISPYRVVKYVTDEKEILAQRAIPMAYGERGDKTSGIELAGSRGIKTRIALCCSPLPGEKIQGYVTTQAYAAIHKIRCPSFMRVSVKNPERVVPAAWQPKAGSRFVKIKIAAFDRVGLLQEVSSAISNMGINILSVSSKESGEPDVTILITMEVFDVDQLRLLLKTLEKIKSVREAKRI
ncbi:MAG: bifunctional (p)ppGpp synthetase/guanosine-3',5'-bis(diphosphate) 3'-pyrophosphohydrolase [Candidatus Spechtbacteria bacterium]|nr:bifunctional (p)ppGpp synthetase/guanosine-3',5'-bis(diphosphate) 3'-pyrophosphohydrolase [Candidatus Spechtbacteria bacterium]